MLIKDFIGQRSEPVISIPSAAPLREAATLLKNENIGALPVIDDTGTLAGFISERDIVHNIGSNGEFDPERPVDQVMSTNVIECDLETTIETALRLMRMLHIRHMPVMTEQNLVGVVSLRDLAFWRMEDIEGERNKVLHSEQGYWDYIEKSPDATYVEIDGQIVFANEKTADLFAAKTVDNLLGPQSTLIGDRAFHDIIQEREQLDITEGEWLPFAEVEYQQLDGTAFIGEWTSTTILWRGETAILHVVRNTSGRKRPEIKAANTNLEVRQVTE